MDPASTSHRWTADRVATLALAGILVLGSAGCASSPGSATLRPTIAPTIAPSLPPTTSSAIDAVAYVDSWCVALGELTLAFGNPDTNSKSEAWTSFEAAGVRRDAAALDEAAGRIRSHLEAAWAANHRGMLFAPGRAASRELEAVLMGLLDQVSTVRGAVGDAATTAQASTTMQAIWPRFLTHLQLLSAMADAHTISRDQMENCQAAREPNPSG